MLSQTVIAVKPKIFNDLNASKRFHLPETLISINDGFRFVMVHEDYFMIYAFLFIWLQKLERKDQGT
jgi:hypothetical protein